MREYSRNGLIVGVAIIGVASLAASQTVGRDLRNPVGTAYDDASVGHAISTGQDLSAPGSTHSHGSVTGTLDLMRDAGDSSPIHDTTVGAINLAGGVLGIADPQQTTR